MPSGDMDILEFKRVLLLGGRVSHKHKFFQTIAKLGYEEAQEMALLEFWIWLEKHPKSPLEKMLKKYLELFGMAKFLPTSKEITRLAMILGDTTEVEEYE